MHAEFKSSDAYHDKGHCLKQQDVSQMRMNTGVV